MVQSRSSDTAQPRPFWCPAAFPGGRDLIGPVGRFLANMSRPSPLARPLRTSHPPKDKQRLTFGDAGWHGSQLKALFRCVPSPLAREGCDRSTSDPAKQPRCRPSRSGKATSARTLLTLTLLTLLPAASAWAHPHLFATARLGITTDGTGAVTGLDVVLVYDEGSTAAEIDRIETSRPGPLDDAALSEQMVEDIGYLKEFGYFVELRQGQQKLAVDTPRQVVASRATGLLFVAYHVPLATPVRPSTDAPLIAATFDPTYFTEIKTVAEIPPTVPAHCAATVTTPPAGPVSAQPAAPLRTIFDFSAAYAENARREAHWFAMTCAAKPHP